MLVKAGKIFDLMLTTISRRATTKRRQWQMLGDLRENRFSAVH